MHGGILVALAWIITQAALWTACAAATLFLGVLLTMLLLLPFTTLPQIGTHP